MYQDNQGTTKAYDLLYSLLVRKDILTREITDTRAILRERVARSRLEFTKENFELETSMKVSEDNFVIRYQPDGKRQTKPARFWGRWVQRDQWGREIARWCGPCVRQWQPYPEFIKPRFLSYRVREWHRGIFTPPPGWFRPNSPAQHIFIDDEVDFKGIEEFTAPEENDDVQRG